MILATSFLFLSVFSFLNCFCWNIVACQMARVVKYPPPNAGDIRDAGPIPEWGRSSGGGHCNPLQYSCLENPMHRGASWAPIHSVTKSQHN